jgi:outer membrane protein assembly factor BamE
MRKPVVLTVSLVALLVSVGCQTTLGTDFAKIKPGMEKAQVLDIVGSPNRTQRWRGLDRWTYFFYEQEAREEREVHFSQGVTSYVGERYQNPVSAEQQDESNEMANRAIEERIKLNREEASRNLENYESEMRGTESNPAYVPSFDPVQ